MKSLFFFLFTLSYSFAIAQNCISHALMKKGTQLEYLVYSSHYRNGQKLRLVFEVAGVTDSAGSTYSTVIKKGIGIKDENDHYEKRIRLQCDGKNLLLPFDFYSADTTYWYDFNSMTKNGGFHTGIAPLKNANYVIPLVLEGVARLPEGVKQVKQKATVRSFEQATHTVLPKGEVSMWLTKWEALRTIKNMKVEGKETVTTAAGSFQCYVIGVDCDFQFNGAPLTTKYTLYYNNEVGLVKMEITSFEGKQRWGASETVELISVKK